MVPIFDLGIQADQKVGPPGGHLSSENGVSKFLDHESLFPNLLVNYKWDWKIKASIIL